MASFLWPISAFGEPQLVRGCLRYTTHPQHIYFCTWAPYRPIGCTSCPSRRHSIHRKNHSTSTLFRILNSSMPTIRILSILFRVDSRCDHIEVAPFFLTWFACFTWRQLCTRFFGRCTKSNIINRRPMIHKHNSINIITVSSNNIFDDDSILCPALHLQTKRTRLKTICSRFTCDDYLAKWFQMEQQSTNFLLR